jgi:DNA-binding NtrC family response regulator
LLASISRNGTQLADSNFIGMWFHLWMRESFPPQTADFRCFHGEIRCMARILIWGDGHDSCLLTKRVLEKQNHTAAVFTALHEAIEWAKTHQPDLAILDSREEFAAVNVLKTLKSLNPGMNVFMTTTYAPASAHVQTIRLLGAEVYFSRPIAIDELEKRMLTLCSQTKRR